MCESDVPEDLKIMELTILSKKQLCSQNWSFSTGRIFKAIFPSAFSSTTKLKYLNLSPFGAFFPKRALRIPRKKGTLPYSCARYRYFRNCLTSSVLRRILKESKNLKSLCLEIESVFKGIRRIQGLRDLALKINTGQILAYPQLFQHLNSLQKLELYLEWSSDTDARIMSKFFGFVLNLPKLQSFTVWLDQGWNYYKNLLLQIHLKSLPSFEIIVLDTTAPPDLPNSSINWADYVDTLYLGPINPSECQYLTDKKWSSRKEQGKVVKFNNPFRFNEEDVKNGSSTIKNLLIVDLFCQNQNPSGEDIKGLRTFISNMKTLENLTLSLGQNFMKSRNMISPFLQQFAQIKSLENLTSLTFNLNDIWGALLEVPPPYSYKMKNLRNLCLILYGKWVNLSDWTEALKGLMSLESFHFVYAYSIRERIIYWDFPFGWLLNLKRIYLHCGNPFMVSSIDKFFQGISQVEKLSYLEISGRILEEADREKVERFVENLRRKESLETANVTWKELKVIIQRVNGKLVVSSERSRERKRDSEFF